MAVYSYVMCVCGGAVYACVMFCIKGMCTCVGCVLSAYMYMYVMHGGDMCVR